MDFEKCTEQEMREFKELWPESEQELIDHIRELAKANNDYGKAAYVISLAAVATFRYMSHLCGITGFQASCADMDILRRNRHYEDGFRIIDYNNLLYPQYWTDEHFPTREQLLQENLPRLQKKAKELLAQTSNASPNVKKHWETIVATKSTKATA